MRFGGSSNSARPQILGALLSAAAHGLHMLPQVRLNPQAVAVHG